MLSLTIALIISLIYQSNSQINCSNAKDATTTAGEQLVINAVLCEDDNMIYIVITYANYNNNYFGIVFSENMYGDALVYTTGKSGETRPEALYAYTNSASSPRSNGVIYQPNDDWTEVETDNSNGIRVIYKKPLADTPWDLTTTSIKVGYAIGSTLELNNHNNNRNNENEAYTLDFTSSGSSTTDSPTNTPSTSKGCDAQDLVPATTTMSDFEITLAINCTDNNVTVTIKYSNYNSNWFGIVFSKNMIGSALIYTTGKDGTVSEGLHSYTLSDWTINQVTYDGIENDWTKKKAVDENGVFVVEYEQTIDKSPFTRQTERVPVRWAKGGSLTLSQHASGAGRSDETKYLDLSTGVATTVKDDLSLEIAHGIIMWVTWAILASIGIMSSSFRYLFPAGPKWFFVHRGVQITVVILNIIGFIIAIVFTENKGKKHFTNSHMIIGLVVTIVSVLQPINALFRPHPPENGWTEKPIGRRIWELIHKVSGYSVWILGCVAAMLGMQLLGEYILSYVHMFGWCGLLLVGYILLFGIGWRKENLKKQTGAVNENPGGDAKAREKLVGNESP